MKVLFFQSAPGVYAESLAKNLNTLGIEVDILYIKSLSIINYSPQGNMQRRLKSITPIPFVFDIPKFHSVKYYFLKSFLQKNQNYYDICNIHYISEFYIPIIKYISRAANSLVVSVWGSDYLRGSDRNRKMLIPAFEEANCITFNNEEVQQDFLKYFGFNYKNKVHICRFGISILDMIKSLEKKEDISEIKKSMGFNADSILVTCGYNASAGQQHAKMIESILSQVDNLSKNTVFIFPLTYGERRIVRKVKGLMSRSNLNYILLKDYMSDEDIARLRMITDIFIQVQTTDQLSASMQESIFAGNIVITGSWLPYKIFESRNAVLFKVENVEEVGMKLIDCIDNLKYYKEISTVNRNIIWEMSNWFHNAKVWKELYDSVISHTL